MLTDALLSKLAQQKEHVERGGNRSLKVRKRHLQALKRMLQAHVEEWEAALASDLGKHAFEAYSSEIGFLHMELNHTLEHMESWAATVAVESPLIHWPSSSYIQKEALGQVLIISPWNYPLMLCLAPAISALAAGNAVVIKPSELAPATAQLLEKRLPEYISEEVALVVNGEGRELIPELLAKHRFDHIFFTGSEHVGRKVYQMAADQLCPVTLELGGKSPCIVDETVDLKVSARRIVWAKFWNAGQTCVAPDYVIVHRSVKAAFIRELQNALRSFFGAEPKQSASLSRIISTSRLLHLQKLLEGCKCLNTPEFDTASRYMAPVIVDEPALNHPLMQEEIFGPILPILTYESEEEVLRIVRSLPNPLSLYIFSRNEARIRFFETHLRFGGGVVNMALIHLANPALPFGGVGQSGFGSCHGKFGFDTFTQQRAMMRTGFFPDIPVRYAPFGRWNRLLRWLMR